MQQKKRHHFVPKAYLSAFTDERGRLLVYRKDAPAKPLHVTPDATQFRGYYYSQPTPEGDRDNNTLEDLFAAVEERWPETVARLHGREGVNDRLEGIFEFMTLQRVRVPAARDMAEAMLARQVKDTMEVMQARGKLPPPPPGLEHLLQHVEVSIDPRMSLHAMIPTMRTMAKIYERIGVVAVHNSTPRRFLTSDNPVIWFDPTLPFDQQQPYTVDPESGGVFLYFPVSPTLAIIGSEDYQAAYSRHGLLHTDVPDEPWVAAINEQVSRFAYEAVIAQSVGQEDIISKYAGVSPVHHAVEVLSQGRATMHGQTFGARRQKPKWHG